MGAPRPKIDFYPSGVEIYHHALQNGKLARFAPCRLGVPKKGVKGMVTKKRQSDGRFRKSIWTGEIKNGKKVYKQIVAHTKTELNEKVEQYEQMLNGEEVTDSTNLVTFYNYACGWQEAYKAARSDNTRMMYENIVKVHFRDVGNVPLATMTPADALRIVNRMDGHPATQVKIVLTIKQVVRQAVRDDVISMRRSANIIDSMPKIKYRSREKRPLTDDEIKAVKTAKYKYPMDELFVLLIYGCGLRREEALALTQDDFDWNHGTVKIDKALAIVNRYTVLKEPKTANSVRTLPIPQSMRKSVKSALRATENGRFQTSDGRLVTHTAYRRMWERIIEALKATGHEIGDDLTAHVFRHNYITTLCYQIPAISLKKVAQLSGDREDTILKIYNHIVTERENVDDALSIF